VQETETKLCLSGTACRKFAIRDFEAVRLPSSNGRGGPWYRNAARKAAPPLLAVTIVRQALGHLFLVHQSVMVHLHLAFSWKSDFVWYAGQFHEDGLPVWETASFARFALRAGV
jgi:hypothetical protein